MNMLIAAAIVFLAIHFLISGTRLRDTITGAIGLLGRTFARATRMESCSISRLRRESRS
jgi:hypothetical protein